MVSYPSSILTPRLVLRYDGDLKPNSSPSLEEDEGFSDWTQRRERQRQQRLQELSQGGEEDEEEEEVPINKAVKSVQASRLQRQEQVDRSKMEVETETERERRKEREEEAIRAERVRREKEREEEEKKRKSEEAMARRREEIQRPNTEVSLGVPAMFSEAESLETSACLRYVVLNFSCSGGEKKRS